jgi:hypothetical protein
MLRKNEQIIAQLLVVIFAFYYANICFFYHSHVINGATIVHSHIYNKSHTQIGAHGESEITLISALSVFQSLHVAVCLTGMGLFLLFQALVLPFWGRRIIPNPVACVSLRAPPAAI